MQLWAREGSGQARCEAGAGTSKLLSPLLRQESAWWRLSSALGRLEGRRAGEGECAAAPSKPVLSPVEGLRLALPRCSPVPG